MNIRKAKHNVTQASKANLPTVHFGALTNQYVKLNFLSHNRSVIIQLSAYTIEK